MRFNSRTLRRIATLIFTLNTLIYMAVIFLKIVFREVPLLLKDFKTRGGL